MRAALAAATLLVACGAALAIVDPAADRVRTRQRLTQIGRDVEDLDVKIRAPGLASTDFQALQDLRTSLEQERKLLEERERVLERIERAGLLMHAKSPDSTGTAKSLWEKGGWARYQGVLLCADCDGIQTELTLYNDGNRYLLTERYLGPSAPDRTFKSEGIWTTLRGHGKDPDATVFELDYDKPGRERHFLRLSDAELRLVGLDASKLRKQGNLSLKRVAP